MRTLLFILTLALLPPGKVCSQGLALGLPKDKAVTGRNSPEFKAYQQRLKDRRTYALKIRRENYLNKPPARGWLAVSVPYNPMNPQGVGITGVIPQPPIPRRRSFWDRLLDILEDTPTDHYHYRVPRL